MVDHGYAGRCLIDYGYGLGDIGHGREGNVVVATRINEPYVMYVQTPLQRF